MIQVLSRRSLVSLRSYLVGNQLTPLVAKPRCKVRTVQCAASYCSSKSTGIFNDSEEEVIEEVERTRKGLLMKPRDKIPKEIRSIDEDFRTFADVKVDDFEELIKSDEDRELVAKILDNYEYLKYVSYRVPTNILPKYMQELMVMYRRGANQSIITAFYNYMFKTEASQVLAKAKRMAAHQEYMRKKEARPSTPPGMTHGVDNKPIYAAWHNNFVVWKSDADIREGHSPKKIDAAIFGQKLVFDFSYEEFMQKREIVNSSKQISDAYSYNYHTREPYDLYFCNLKQGSITAQMLNNAMPNLYEKNSFVTCEERSYLDIFPKEKLVYLTPHTQNVLDEYDRDDIYIIGSLVDRSVQKPVSMAKAKKEGIRMGRLPIDKHVIWANVSKVLTLNQIVYILLSTKMNGGDWKKAMLEHIPKRKLKSREEIEEEEARRLKKMTFQRKRMFTVNSDDNYRSKPDFIDDLLRGRKV